MKKNRVLSFFLFLSFSIVAQHQKVDKSLFKGRKYIESVYSDSSNCTIDFYKQYSSVIFNIEFQFDENEVFQPITFEDSTLFYFSKGLFSNSNLEIHPSLIEFYSRTEGLDKLMLWSVYPDTLIYDSVIDTLLLENSKVDANPRNVAHIALVYSWLCLKSENKSCSEIEKYKSDYIQILKKGYNDDSILTDTEIESLLGICFFKEQIRSKRKLKRLLIDSQNADGGWSYNSSVLPVSNWHTTFIALWLLKSLLKEPRVYMYIF